MAQAARMEELTRTCDMDWVAAVADLSWQPSKVVSILQALSICLAATEGTVPTTLPNPGTLSMVRTDLGAEEEFLTLFLLPRQPSWDSKALVAWLDRVEHRGRPRPIRVGPAAATAVASQ